MKNAFVAAEDARFYSHNGIDLRRIFAAAAADIKSGSYKQGGSTITQQLIKNSHLSGTKKLSRKIQEALLACQLEARFSKEEIMQMYLNYVYFGNGAYGIEAAARTYFDKSASELTLAESAALADTVKAPSLYSPAHPNACMSRRNTVLRLMYKNGLIDLAALILRLKPRLKPFPAHISTTTTATMPIVPCKAPLPSPRSPQTSCSPAAIPYIPLLTPGLPTPSAVCLRRILSFPPGRRNAPPCVLIQKPAPCLHWRADAAIARDCALTAPFPPAAVRAP